MREGIKVTLKGARTVRGGIKAVLKGARTVREGIKAALKGARTVRGGIKAVLKGILCKFYALPLRKRQATDGWVGSLYTLQNIKGGMYTLIFMPVPVIIVSGLHPYMGTKRAVFLPIHKK